MTEGIIPKEQSDKILKANIHALIKLLGADVVADWAHCTRTDIYKFSNPNEPRSISGAQVRLLAREACSAGYPHISKQFIDPKTSKIVDRIYGEPNGDLPGKISKMHAVLGELNGLAKLGNLTEAFAKHKEAKKVLLDILAELQMLDVRFKDDEENE